MAQDPTLKTYWIYLTDKHNIVRYGESLQCADDGHAIAMAETHVGELTVEVWYGFHLIRRIEGDEKSSERELCDQVPLA